MTPIRCGICGKPLTPGSLGLPYAHTENPGRMAVRHYPKPATSPAPDDLARRAGTPAGMQGRSGAAEVARPLPLPGAGSTARPSAPLPGRGQVGPRSRQRETSLPSGVATDIGT